MAAEGASHPGALPEAVVAARVSPAPSWDHHLSHPRGQGPWEDHLPTKDHHRRTMVTVLHHLRDPHHHSTWVQVQVHTVTAWDLSRPVPMVEVAAPTSNSPTLRHSREEVQLLAQPLLTSRDHTHIIRRSLRSLPTQHHRVTTVEEDPAVAVHLPTGLRATLLLAPTAPALPAPAARNRLF